MNLKHFLQRIFVNLRDSLLALQPQELASIMAKKNQTYGYCLSNSFITKGF